MNTPLVTDEIQIYPTGVQRDVPDGFSFTRHDVYVDGQVIGVVSIADYANCRGYFSWHTSPSPVATDDAWISYAQINNPEYLHRGLGKEIYRAVGTAAIGKGARFRSDPDGISQSAKNVWDSLVRSGEARTVRDFAMDADGDYMGGLYIMRSNNFA